MGFKKILLCGLFVGFVSPAVHAAVYDVSTDFSTTSNPNGPWSYGRLADTGTNLNYATSTFALDTAQASPFHGATGINGWQNETTLSGGYTGVPVVLKNTTGASINFDSTITVPGGAVFIHPLGETNSQNIAGDIRFIVPTTSVYNIDASFASADSHGATTDVHVYLNGSAIPGLSGAVSGNTVAFPTTPVLLTAGDTVDFIVGTNNNTYGNDGTTVAATLTSVPEPGLIGIAGLGLCGALIRRRTKSA